ncbi:cell division protein Cdc14 [Amylostereum chailletii]|nr:cell division protein Cdc14 [Amylostereum chailletii]
MDDLLATMQTAIRDSLDLIVSARSSMVKRGQALNDLEQLIARTLSSAGGAEALEQFSFLQDTFECNIPSRLLDWLSVACQRLDHLLTRGNLDSERSAEASTLSSQLVQALALVQGVALVHHRSKIFLGRKHSVEVGGISLSLILLLDRQLQVLIDLLWVSRHVGSDTSTNLSSSTSAPSTPGTKPKTSSLGLSSAVLDTLLCILVDSSPALRIFEKSSGVQTVVKLLKRPNALREVKMKCLEFLYFYLLDEKTSADMPAPTLPPPPLSPSPFIAEMRTSERSRLFRDASSGSDDSYSSGSSRSSSSSQSSASSLSSSTSISSSSTVAPTTPPNLSPKTPPRSPTTPNANRRPFAKPRSLLMLQKDVDFTPLSPKKAHVARLGVGHARQSSMNTPDSRLRNSTMASDNIRVSEDTSEDMDGSHDLTRTTDQKKAFLGSMLGNVDSLVEGMRTAGVWGLPG